jgi:hypothetical protein
MKTIAVILLTVFMITFSFAQEKGKIVFSKSPINVENPKKLTTTFATGDHIYAVAFFTKPIKKQCKGKISKSATKYVVEVLLYKNDMYFTSMNPTLKNEIFDGDVLVLDLAPDASNMTAYTNPNLSWKMYGNTKEGPLRFCEILSEMEESNITIKIEIKACYEVIASGEFKLEGNDFGFYENLMADLQNSETQSVKMSKPKKNDNQLEKEMITALQNSGNDTWNGEIKKVVIIDNDWFIERHKISGVILFRYIRAEVAIKKSDGCYLYKLVTFKQHYISDKFDKTFWDGAGDRLKIPCENI